MIHLISELKMNRCTIYTKTINTKASLWCIRRRQKNYLKTKNPIHINIREIRSERFLFSFNLSINVFFSHIPNTYWHSIKRYAYLFVTG